MATTEDSITLSVTRPVVERPSLGSLRFDWIAAFLAFLNICGTYVDGWAHAHGLVDNTFFTPWHAILYASFVIIAVFFTLSALFNHLKRGYPWSESLPPGYLLSLLGVAVFAVAGVLDMFWHILFGIEVNVDALLSPTHLMLALGAILMATGPLRACWLRYPASQKLRFLQFLPGMLSATLLFSLLAFFTQFSHPAIDPWAAHAYQPIGYPSLIPFYSQALGIDSILLQTAILMSFVLLLTRRWQLPFGSFTLLFTLNAIFISFLNDYYVLIIPIALAGLSADILCRWLKPGVERPGAFRIFAFTVPCVYYSLYFTTLLIIVGVDWTVHMWAGSIVIAGVTGLLLSYLLIPPLYQPAKRR